MKKLFALLFFVSGCAVAQFDLKVDNTGLINSPVTGTQFFTANVTPLSAALASIFQAKDADLDAFAGKTAPTGDVVGTSDTQALTNKSVNGVTLAGSGTLNTTGGTFSGTTSGTNTGDQTAATVSNSPAGNIASATVQNAINELDSEKAGLALNNIFTGSLNAFQGDLIVDNQTEDGSFVVRGGTNKSGFFSLYANNGVGSRWIFWADKDAQTHLKIYHYNGLPFFGPSLDLDRTGNVKANSFFAVTSSVTYASSIALNVTSKSLFRIDVLTGNVTFTTPTNTSGETIDGKRIYIETVQDGTGGRTISFSSDFIDPATNSTVATLSGQSANVRTFFEFEYNSTASKWYLVATPETQPNWNLRKIIHVSQRSSATDTRTGINVYDENRPFATPEAAVAAATSGDTIVVEPGTYTITGNLAKDGVNWRGERGTIFNATANNLILFDDGGTAMTFYVTGFESLITTGTNSGICKSTNSSSSCIVQEIDYVQSSTAFLCDGGTIVCNNINNAVATNGPVVQVDGNGYCEYYGNNVTGVSGLVCNSGVLYARAFTVGADPDNGIYCGSNGYMIFNGQYVHGETNAVKNAGGNLYANCQFATGNNYAISSTGSGTAIVKCSEYHGGVAVESGTGTLSITAGIGQGIVSGGTDASSTLNLTILHEVTTSGNPLVAADAGKLNLRGKFKTTGSTEPVIKINSATTGLVLQDCVLVADPSATNSIEKVTGTPTIKVYRALSNKGVQAGITQQVSTVLADSNVE